MNTAMKSLVVPNGHTKYLFFGGKGGVGKTTMSTATAVWFADHGYRTTIVSTDPTVSLSAVFGQQIGGSSRTLIRQVQNLCGVNINPEDAKGVFQSRFNNLMGQVTGAFGSDIVSTPCAEEMATFDQFVGFLDEPDSDVVVFDTAPTGKTLRELAMPFDWAGFLERQIQQGKELAQLMGMDESALDAVKRDKQRYEKAMQVMKDKSTTVFTLVLLPERLPIEESQSAITGLGKLGISVQAMIINQSIQTEVIQGNEFLTARASLQAQYQAEIETRFSTLVRNQVPLFDHDTSALAALRRVGEVLYGN